MNLPTLHSSRFFFYSFAWFYYGQGFHIFTARKETKKCLLLFYFQKNTNFSRKQPAVLSRFFTHPCSRLCDLKTKLQNFYDAGNYWFRRKWQIISTRVEAFYKINVITFLTDGEIRSFKSNNDFITHFRPSI